MFVAAMDVCGLTERENSSACSEGFTVMIEILKKSKVVICMGTGGVGKTTLSASLGVLAAQEGLRTLVLTIDPAQRLAQALGVENAPGREVAVDAIAGLSACMIDPRQEFDAFVLGHVENRIAEGLFRNPLYQQLVGSLSGSQEFTSLIRLYNSVQSGRYDLVILDTPPAQNSVEFLRAPERIYALFQETVIRWFAPQIRPSLLTRLVNRGTSLVTAALEKVTGSQFITELRDFFAHLSHLQGKVTDMSLRVQRLLHSDETAIVLVTGFDETKLKEALEFQQELRRDELNLRAIIVNRAFPVWQGRVSAEAPQALVALYEQMEHFYQDRIASYEAFSKQIGEAVPILRLPDYNQAVMGISDLTRLAQQIRERWGQSHD